jgi:hypothetical protein
LEAGIDNILVRTLGDFNDFLHVSPTIREIVELIDYILALFFFLNRVLKVVSRFPLSLWHLAYSKNSSKPGSHKSQGSNISRL